MLSQISIGDNVFDSEQSSSAMDPNRPSKNLSASLQSPDSCGILDDDVSQRMVALNLSGKDVLVSAFDSISIAEASLREEDDKGKDIVKADDASESKCLDNVYIVPQRRSGRNNKLSWHLATIPAKSGRRTAVKKTSVDLNSLKITRKRRSYCSKQARSSVWGLLDNLIQASEHKGGIEIAPSEHKNSKTAKKGGRGNGKHGKNQTGRNSSKSKGKSSIPTGPISLKVKFGPRCLLDVIPLVDNDIDKNYTTGEELKEFPKIVSNVDDSLEEFPSMQLYGCNGNLDNEYVSVSNICLPGKNISQNPAAKSLDCHLESLFQEGTLIDNRCSDPGTSPDSEVINLIPDTPISVRVPEDLHDLTSSKPCAAPGDAPSLIMHEKNSKNGREKDRLPNSSCGVEDLFSPESMSNAQIFGHFMQGEKQRGVSYCSDSSALTIAGNGLGHMSSGEIFSGELLPCSGVSYLGTSCASSKLEFGLQGNLSSSLGTESPESEFSEILVSSHDDRKVSSGGRPKVFIKSRSGFPKSSKRREYAPKKKGNQKKQDITHELNKNTLVKGLGEVKGQSGTGNGGISNVDISSEIEQGGSGKLNLDGGISNVDILRSEVGEQHHLLPRKAWVQCDVCHKWRRIPAALADQIEETNCKWTCKENLDKLYADCSIDQEKSNSEINAELEISDASGDEGASGTCFYSKRSGQQKPLVVHQSSWTLIKSNLFLHRSRKNQTIDEIMVCHCKPPSDGRMGCGDECLNRMLNIECVRRTCPCGEFCSNQQFQKRDYSKLECFKCGKKGHGLQLLEDVSEGQFLIEYVGEVLDMHAYEARQHEYALRGHKHFYFMTLNGSEVIDACAKGNLGRFVNHSCDPNCRTEKWMVNGEVCIGLFALRDIKKGEELTFDYNYVRVFGAAAKKCVCGSPQCRGYIGGDLLNAEVVVQDDSDDEYPEPVVLGEDGNMDKLDNIISAANSFNVAEIRTQQDPPENKNILDESSARNRKNSSQTHLSNILSQENVSLGNTVAAISLNVREESKNFPDGPPASALKMETSVGVEGLESLLQSPIQPVETSLSSEDASETMSGLIKECSLAGEVMKCSLSSAKEVEVTPLDAIVSKSLKKSKFGNGQHRHDSLKSCPLVKNTRESSSMKKGGKPKNTAVKSLPDVDSKLQISQPQYKKPPDGSSNDRFVAVEEKLNELLGHDGGISKHKDASKCYLKLLLLTAASGDSCNGEAIQSNRGLSMILDALLKTKSRTVLVDIINKNGLQMLHNIMKRYRREFNKIPILRKLLKILEHLAVREILSHEHINGSPSRPGVESFRDSILRLTEHTDKQVHQIARNFRDRWIPRHLRKIGCIERDDSRMDLHSGSYYNRCSSLQNQSCDRGAKPSAETENTCHSTVASTQPDASMLDGSSASCSDIGVACEPKKRKRKSRWDQEAEPNSDPRIASNVADDRRQVVDDDLPPGYEFPPGFSIPINASGVLCDSSSTAVYSLQEHCCRKQPHPVVIGHLQQRFISRLPVSYGIPYPKVQEFGTPLKERFSAWDIAPGIPFQPFPPLPPYPRTRTFSIPSASSGAFSQLRQSTERDCHTRLPCQSAQNPSSISATSLPQDSAGTQLRSQPAKDSHNVERNFFRKQHFNKVPPPWIRGRSGWGIHRKQL